MRGLNRFLGLNTVITVILIIISLAGCELPSSSNGNPATGSGKSTTKEITEFQFLAADNTALASDITTSISATDITATVPYGTDISALVAGFTTTGQDVTVGATVQQSGITANDFSNPVTYTVHAEDGTTLAYTVTVIVELNPASLITGFRFTALDNTALSSDVVAVIDRTDITAAVPYGTDISALKAAFTTSGAEVTVGATVQQSGITANDFSTPVTYTVHAQDGATLDYLVTVKLLVQFPDANLEAVIRQKINKPSGDIYYADVKDITSLSANGKSIKDITGLETLTALTKLYLNYNTTLSDISVLAGLSNLTELKLEDCSISDITPLGGLSLLTILYLDSNSITDISALGTLSNLTILYLLNNPISDITVLAGLNNLTILDLGYCSLTDISPLASLTLLTTLYLDGNTVADISPLAGLNNLIELDLGYCKLTDITPLASLSLLTFLYLDSNTISDISSLSGLNNLDDLDIQNNNMDLTNGSANYTVVQTLQGYGCTVYYKSGNTTS